MYLAGTTRAVAAPLPLVPMEKAPMSSKVMAMMRNMGYEPGTGLGASNQGRLQPIAMGALRGRAGLGHPVYNRGEVEFASEDW